MEGVHCPANQLTIHQLLFRPLAQLFIINITTITIIIIRSLDNMFIIIIIIVPLPPS